MPLPMDVLEQAEGKLNESKELTKELYELREDMQLSGMDTTTQDEQLRTLENDQRQLELFIARQKKRHEGNY